MKILIVDDIHLNALNQLSKIGLSVDYHPNITKHETLKTIHRYDGIIIRSKFLVQADFFTQAKKLKFLARVGSGTDNIDETCAKQHNVTLISAPEGNCQAVAEHTIGIMLMMLNKLYKCNNEVKRKIWNREGNRGIELSETKIGIIGYGHVGSTLAKQLKGFGCDIMAYDRFLCGYTDQFVQEATLQQIQQSCQIITIHTNLNDTSKNIINQTFFDNLVQPIYLINTSRGEVLVLKDLLQALKSGKVIAAGLDVLENEKLDILTTSQAQIYQELFDHDNVIFSPHIAGWTVKSYKKLSEVIVQKIGFFIDNY